MDKEQLELLEEFVDLCRIRPSTLHSDDLKFFRDWLLELGCTLPTESRSKHNSDSYQKEEPPYEPMEEILSSEESDLDISMEGVINCDEVTYEQVMGDQTMEVTEEMQDTSDDKRNEALTQFREGNYDESIKLFTEAIKLNPNCAMLYAKRASCYVKMKCPNAAIKDCNKSFELNPDSALAFKWRGISFKLLGKWEEAFSDLTQSLKLDYADDTHEHMKDVESRAKRIREHKRKYERKREDKVLNEKREKIRRAQEAHEKAGKAKKSEHDHGTKCKGAGGGASMPPGVAELLSDPELVEDLKDPAVMAALSEIMSNPGAMLKYQNDPKIGKIINKMQAKFSGMGAGARAHTGGHEHGGTDRSSNTAPKTNIADDLD